VPAPPHRPAPPPPIVQRHKCERRKQKQRQDYARASGVPHAATRTWQQAKPELVAEADGGGVGCGGALAVVRAAMRSERADCRVATKQLTTPPRRTSDAAQR